MARLGFIIVEFALAGQKLVELLGFCAYTGESSSNIVVHFLM